LLRSLVVAAAAIHDQRQTSRCPPGFYEDKEQERCSLQAFLTRSGAGGLKTLQWLARTSVANAPVPLPAPGDAAPAVQFGGIVQLVHVPSSACLAIDVHNMVR
jgi:hypothetical protein